MKAGTAGSTGLIMNMLVIFQTGKNPQQRQQQRIIVERSAAHSSISWCGAPPETGGSLATETPAATSMTALDPRSSGAAQLH